MTAATVTEPTSDGRIGPRRVVTDTLVIARRNLLRNVRLPQLLLFSTIQPVMFLLLFTFVFGGARCRCRRGSTTCSTCCRAC